MSIRQCALESEAFIRLRQVYGHREAEAAAWRAKGGKVAGELGSICLFTAKLVQSTHLPLYSCCRMSYVCPHILLML